MPKGVVRLILDSRHSKWHDSFWISKIVVDRSDWRGIQCLCKSESLSELTQKDPDSFLKYLFKKTKIKKCPHTSPARPINRPHARLPMWATDSRMPRALMNSRQFLPVKPPIPTKSAPDVHISEKQTACEKKYKWSARIFVWPHYTSACIFVWPHYTWTEDGGNSFQLFSTHSPCRWTHSPCLAYVV
jgi:hypothetical protein